MAGSLIATGALIAGKALATTAARAFANNLGPFSIINCPSFARPKADEALNNRELNQSAVGRNKYTIFYNSASNTAQQPTQPIPGVKPLKP